MHGHDHGPPSGADQTRAFALGTALNLGFVIVEAVFGWISGSVALIADAAHNLSDVLGLLLAWGAVGLARRPPSSRRTYGLRKATVLAALGNALLILIAVIGLGIEAVRRFRDPVEVHSLTVIVVALVGVLINAGSALLFARGRKHDANQRAVFLHLAADAAVSLAVVFAGVGMWLTGWHWLDPAVSLLVAVVLLFSTWPLLREGLDLALDAVPDRIDIDAVKAFLIGLPEVHEVHDLHVWPMSTTEVALTAHLLVPWDACPSDFLHRTTRALREQYGIDHATLQMEPLDGAGCELADDEHV